MSYFGLHLAIILDKKRDPNNKLINQLINLVIEKHIKDDSLYRQPEDY
jgi:hypothetical protein